MEAHIKYGDAVIDFGNVVGTPGLQAATVKVAEMAYSEARRLAPPVRPPSPSRILKSPQIEIYWSDEEDQIAGVFEDRMDTS
jgi:hypothetical protein